MQTVSRERVLELAGVAGVTLDDRQVDELREQGAALARILVDLYREERRRAVPPREVAHG